MNNLATRIIEFVKTAPHSVSAQDFVTASDVTIEAALPVFERLHVLRLICINRPSRELAPAQRTYYTRREFRPLVDILTAMDGEPLTEALAAYDAYELSASRAFQPCSDEAVGALEPHYEEEEDIDDSDRDSNAPENWA